MREIKFRGKRVDNGEWVYGSLIKVNDDYHIHSFRAINTDPTLLDRFMYGVIPESVGQYMGLNDKNSIKIFEGDILKCWHESNCCNEIKMMGIFEVVYHRTGFYRKNGCYDLLGFADETEIREVIGNKFENKDLLCQ